MTSKGEIRELLDLAGPPRRELTFGLTPQARRFVNRLDEFSHNRRRALQKAQDRCATRKKLFLPASGSTGDIGQCFQIRLDVVRKSTSDLQRRSHRIDLSETLGCRPELIE